jgi:hypothetical protein
MGDLYSFIGLYAGALLGGANKKITENASQKKIT